MLFILFTKRFLYHRILSPPLLFLFDLNFFLSQRNNDIEYEVDDNENKIHSNI
jgi:hypothetical protein